MTYAPSPRPQYDRPTHIRYADVTRHLWGDTEAGRVADWIYISNQQIHQLVFAMPRAGRFTHSDSFRTIFGADEVMIVLEGRLALANPETGEVVVAQEGEGIFFRKDTWHHGFNVGNGEVRVLEYFAPPPLQGTSGAYAQKKTMLHEPDWRYLPEKVAGRWPMAAAEWSQTRTLYKIGGSELLWQLRDGSQKAPVALFADTEHLRAGCIELMPGQYVGPERHRGDESLYLDKGILFIHVQEDGGELWSELNPGDGFYLPAGSNHTYYNLSNSPVRFYFGLAPNSQSENLGSSRQR